MSCLESRESFSSSVIRPSKSAIPASTLTSTSGAGTPYSSAEAGAGAEVGVVSLYWYGTVP
jgi:hypothetical protein